MTLQRIRFKASALLLFPLALILFASGSCKKRVVDIIPESEVEKDMSIPGAGNIKFFAQPSDLVVLAASDTNFIYRSIDGGVTWQKVIISPNTNYRCQGLDMVDANKGVCLVDGDLYYTTNGGATWTASTGIPYNVVYVGIRRDNNTIIALVMNYYDCDIYRSTNNGASFSYYDDFYIVNGDFVTAKVCSSKVFLISKDSYYYDKIYGYDFTTAKEIFLKLGDYAQGDPNDLYVDDLNSGVMVGNGGNIMTKGYSGYNRDYYMHGLTYNHVDQRGNRIVAVGYHTMTTNRPQGEENWSEIWHKGNSYVHTFYRVKVIDDNHFLVSGDNGLLWRIKMY